MGLQNLSRILDKYESQFGSTNTEQFEVLKGLPFNDWESSKINPTKLISIMQLAYQERDTAKIKVN